MQQLRVQHITRKMSDILFKRNNVVRSCWSSDNQKVTQYYQPDIGENFKLHQFLWMREYQPYLRQLRINPS